MTDQQIMAIAPDDLVRLFLLRRDDLKAASKEAARIAMNARRRKDPEYRAYHAEYYRNWREANREHLQEYHRHWHEENREKENEYRRERRRKKALEKQPADISESTSQQVNKSTSQQVNKSTSQRVNKSTSQRVNKPERTSSGAMPIPDFELTQVRRTDKETAAYWRQVLDNLECQFDGREIDVEAYFSRRNAAMSHLLAAEARLKPSKRKEYN